MATGWPAMHDRGQAHATAGEPVNVRVKTRHMLGSVREILGMPSPEKTAPDQLIRNSPRLTVQIPFSYRAIENNVVMPETFNGTILNIGHHGMLAELNYPLPARSEIKLSLDTLLSHTQAMNIDAKAIDIDAGAAEIYGRLIDTRPFYGRNVSGLEFTCVSAHSEQLLMHCMLHIAHARNTQLDDYLWLHERQVTKKTEALRVCKRVVIATLLAASAAIFYLLSILNDALTVVP